MGRKMITCSLFLFFAVIMAGAQKAILLETESFTKMGGWEIDPQYIDIMGSSYLMAHGMGVPVANASTIADLPGAGVFHVWVRTKDWAPFPVGPGKFLLKIGDNYSHEFGSSGEVGWKWYRGGIVKIDHATSVKIELEDLTGFEGRCDAVYLTRDENDLPPNDLETMVPWRKKLLRTTEPTSLGRKFDLVVIGGGMAGICAAVAAARSGLTVALVQNRPVLGGNNSSEIRVHLMGKVDQGNPYPTLGRIVRELDNGDPHNANINGKLYGDDRKESVVKMERNISLFLNMHACQVEMDGNTIKAVTARNIETNEEVRFEGRLFADCTGDGTLGFLSGADYRIGRESKAETGESLAPDKADHFVLGTSNMWHSSDFGKPSEFPETPWALQFTDDYFIDSPTSEWYWETGFNNFDPIKEAEEIRDHNFRAIYGNWSYLKNRLKEKYENFQLDWVAYIGGKRESRRLLGDYVFSEMDCDGTIPTQPDGFVTATWTIDLHFPKPENSRFFPGQEFLTSTEHKRVKPYQVPYRCLYSRNIENLYMAGRNISTTHVAFGSTRVMRTTGMMGELVGYAASLAIMHRTSPRGVYENYLDELRSILINE